MLSSVFHAGLKVANLAEKNTNIFFLFILSKIIKLVQKVPVMTIRVQTNSLESAEFQSLIIILGKTVKPINFSYGSSKFLKNYKTDC